MSQSSLTAATLPSYERATSHFPRIVLVRAPDATFHRTVVESVFVASTRPSAENSQRTPENTRRLNSSLDFSGLPRLGSFAASVDRSRRLTRSRIVTLPSCATTAATRPSGDKSAAALSTAPLWPVGRLFAPLVRFQIMSV